MNQASEEGTVINSKSGFSGTLNTIHEFYITTIQGPEEYAEMFHKIRMADNGDVIRFHINSTGGDAFTTIQLLRCMADTKATTVASVEGMCASAATMIFLSANIQELTPHSIFMIHHYSGAAFGKGKDMFDQIAHMQTWSEDLMKDIYKNFLTDGELADVFNGKEFYMTTNEVKDRLVKRKELFEGEQETKPEPTKTKRKSKKEII